MLDGDSVKLVKTAGFQILASAPVNLFNLTVEGLHNYFVGNSGALAHNAKMPYPYLLDEGDSITQCMAAGTPVHVPDGVRPIELIAPGDEVMVGSSVGDVPAAVCLWYCAEVGHLMKIAGADFTIHCSANHPFWIPGRGWVSASRIRPGDRVAARGSRSFLVSLVQRVDGSARVYGIATETGANFYAGAEGVDVAQWAEQLEHYERLSNPGNAERPALVKGAAFPAAGRLERA